jgi:hypothetical protein
MTIDFISYILTLSAGTRMLVMLSGGNRTRNETLQAFLLYSVSVLEALQEVCSVGQHQHAVVNEAQL